MAVTCEKYREDKDRYFWKEHTEYVFFGGKTGICFESVSWVTVGHIAFGVKTQPPAPGMLPCYVIVQAPMLPVQLQTPYYRASRWQQ